MCEGNNQVYGEICTIHIHPFQFFVQSYNQRLFELGNIPSKIVLYVVGWNDIQYIALIHSDCWLAVVSGGQKDIFEPNCSALHHILS